MLPGLCWGAAGAGGAGGLRGARGERTGVMDEASRGLSKGSLRRFLGVLCHPGASPAPLAEPALAAGGSCASSSGTWEQTPLFSAALGAAEPPARGAGAGVRAAFPLPGEESRRASWPAQISLCLGTRFWVRGMWRARAPLQGFVRGGSAGTAGGWGLRPCGRSRGILWPFPVGCSAQDACPALAPLGTKARPRGRRDRIPPPHGGSAGGAAGHRRSVPR